MKRWLLCIVLACGGAGGGSMADEQIEKLRELCLAPDPVEIYDQALWDRYITELRAYFIEKGYTEPGQPLMGFLSNSEYSFQEVEEQPYIEGRMIDRSKFLLFEGELVARIRNYSVAVRDGPYLVGGDCMTKFPGHIFGYVDTGYKVE